MALLGEDGRGYELARKMESCGVWRTWLGDPTYSTFSQFLSSPSAWDSLMSPDSSKSRALLHLQLRVRALLFDKASASLFSPSSSLHSLNPAYLQLHADDVYFTLEPASQDGAQGPTATSSKNQSKAASGAGSRYVDSEMDGMSQRYRNDELPENWYNQFSEKCKTNKKLVLWDRGELPKRSPVEMASYLTYISNHKKRRVAVKEDQHTGFDNSVTEQPNGSNLSDDDIAIFPEVMYAGNFVPESALLPTNRQNFNPKIKLFGVLDTLPTVPTRSPVMLERLGIRPDYLNTEQGGGLPREKSGPEGNNKIVGPDQASKLSQKVVARALTSVGFEAAMEVPMALFAEVLSNKIHEFGTHLKLLADSYRKQCTAIELLKMLLKVEGFSNVAPLMDLVKDSSKNQQSQSQIQPQQHSSLRLPQQVPRQMHQQMQQIIHSQNLAFQQQQQQQQQQFQQQQQQFQQQQQQIRRRAVATPRPAVEMEKERPLVQVKLENPPDSPLDGNAFNSFNSINSRHPQMQFRQQQLAAMSNYHSQVSNQFRQMGNVQIPSIQSPTMSMVRAPPVKVEGFQELMGGDSSSKHDSEENRITSPIGK